MTEDLNIISDEQERPVFCNDHRDRGTLTYKIRGMDGLKTKTQSRAANHNPNAVQKKAKVATQAAVIQMNSPQVAKQLAQINQV